MIDDALALSGVAFNTLRSRAPKPWRAVKCQSLLRSSLLNFHH